MGTALWTCYPDASAREGLVASNSSQLRVSEKPQPVDTLGGQIKQDLLRLLSL